MEVVEDGESRLYDQVPPGGLFATYLDGEFRYCLKAQVRGDEGPDHPGVVLVPGHDDYDGRPGICSESHFDDTTVVYLPSARLVLRAARDAFAPMDAERKAGDVIWRPNPHNPAAAHMHIVVADHKRLIRVRLGDGHIEMLAPSRHATVYRSWSIVIPSSPGLVELTRYP